MYAALHAVRCVHADWMTNIETTMTKRKTLIIAVVCAGLLGLGCLLWDYLTVDRCLDGGGKWDTSSGKCVFTP